MPATSMRFFRAVTMSVASRSASATPDQSVGLDLGMVPPDDDLGSGRAVKCCVRQAPATGPA